MLVDTSDEEAMTKAGGVGGGGDGASLEEQVMSSQRHAMKLRQLWSVDSFFLSCCYRCFWWR